MSHQPVRQTLYLCFNYPDADQHNNPDFYKELYQAKIEDMKSTNTFSDPHQDSGFDMFCPRKVECPPHSTTKIKMGISFALYNETSKGQQPAPYYMYPRSSISKTPLRLANSVGIIDSGYRGQLMAVVDNISDKPYVVEEGQRLFQVCSGNLTPFSNVKIAEQLTTTERGAGGFGSTGQ